MLSTLKLGCVATRLVSTHNWSRLSATASRAPPRSLSTVRRFHYNLNSSSTNPSLNTRTSLATVARSPNLTRTRIDPKWKYFASQLSRVSCRYVSTSIPPIPPGVLKVTITDEWEFRFMRFNVYDYIYQLPIAFVLSSPAMYYGHEYGVIAILSIFAVLRFTPTIIFYLAEVLSGETRIVVGVDSKGRHFASVAKPLPLRIFNSVMLGMVLPLSTLFVAALMTDGIMAMFPFMVIVVSFPVSYVVEEVYNFSPYQIYYLGGVDPISKVGRS